MKITQNKKNNKRHVATLAVAGFILLAFGASVYALNSGMFLEDKSSDGGSSLPVENKVDYTEPTQDQKGAGIEAKEDFINKNNEDAENPGSVSVGITSLQQSGNTLSVRTMVQTLESGRCTLSLERSGEDTVRQPAVDTQIIGSYSTCKGFDIPTDGLVKGEWRVLVEYEGAASSGSDSSVVSIK